MVDSYMFDMAILFLEPVENYFSVMKDKYQQAEVFLKPVSN